MRNALLLLVVLPTALILLAVGLSPRVAGLPIAAVWAIAFLARNWLSKAQTIAQSATAIGSARLLFILGVELVFLSTVLLGGKLFGLIAAEDSDVFYTVCIASLCCGVYFGHQGLIQLRSI